MHQINEKRIADYSDNLQCELVIFDVKCNLTKNKIIYTVSPIKEYNPTTLWKVNLNQTYQDFIITSGTLHNPNDYTHWYLSV